MRDEAHRGELLDHLGIDRRLRFPVEVVERLLKGEARHLHAHRLVLRLLRDDLGGEHGLEEAAVTELLLRGLFEADLVIKANDVEPESALVAWLGEFLLGAEEGARRRLPA